MIPKKILVPVVTITILGTTAFGVGTQVHAQTKQQPLSSLVEMMSQKFHLDKNQVQTVVDQYKQQQQTKMKANMQNKLEDKLNKLVQQKKITEAQKQAIIQKLGELKNKYNSDSFKKMTPEQRKQAIQNEQTELKSWAQSQGIDPSYLMMRFQKGNLKNWIKPTGTQ